MDKKVVYRKKPFSNQVHLSNGRLTLLLLFLIFHTTSYGQKEEQKLSPQNSILEPKVLNTDFCDDLTLEFINKDLISVDHVRIARWESAFDKFTGDFRTNFKDLDEERFFVQVKDIGASGSGVLLKVESYKRGDDPETSAPIDQQVDIMLTPQGDDTHRSGACLLVTDNDVIDDNFDSPTTDGVSGLLDGTDDEGDDPTIFAEVGGKLKLTYEATIGGAAQQVTKIVDVCDNDVLNGIRNVKVNIVSMRNSSGTATFFSKAEILDHLKNTEKAWGQCCFRFVNASGEKIDEDDISELDAPIVPNDPISLSTGLKTTTSHLIDNQISQFDLTNNEKALLDAVKDDDVKTLDLIFINRSIHDPDGDDFFTDNGARGYSLTSFLQAGSLMDVKYRHTVFITKIHVQQFTVPHEIGHILINAGHYGGLGIFDYNYDEFDLPIDFNLMLNGTISNGVLSTKRLVRKQCDDARLETSLPNIEN